MNRLFFVPLILIFSIGVLPYASADGGGTYSVYDTDRDGYLNRSEFAKFAEVKNKRSRGKENWDFDNVDTDGDSKISEKEMVDALIKNMKRKKSNR